MTEQARKKTAQEVAGTIPCACSDCGMDEVRGTQMIEQYAQQELQAYRDMIKDLLPLAEEVFDSITIDDGASHRQYIQLQAMILRARKLIDIATPTSNPEQS